MNRLVPLLLGNLLLATASSATIEDPDHIIYGNATLFGDPLAPGQVVELRSTATGELLTSYELGSDTRLGDQFALRIPMDAIDPIVEGRARPGDPVRIFVNDVLSAETTVGAKGVAVRLDVDPQNLGTGPSLSITDAQLFEGNAATTQAVFEVSLNTTDADDVVLFWETADNGATGGSNCGDGVTDYLAEVDRQLVLSPGEDQATIEVDVCGDTRIEGTEGFTLEIIGVLNGVETRPQAFATIIDDDDVPTLRLADVTVIEPVAGATTQAVFRPQLSKNSDFEARIAYQTIALNAVPNVDFEPTSGTVVFPPGDVEAEVPVTIFHAPGSLPPRSFFLAFSEPFNVIVDDEEALGVINDIAFRPAVLPGQAVVDGENGVTGLAAPTSLALAPDGTDAYATSEALNAVLHFQRNTFSGDLQLAAVYDTSATGFDTALLEGAIDVVVSPDGGAVYVASRLDNAIAVMARDPGSGALSFIENQADGALSTQSASEPNAGLGGVRRLLVSADGAHLYAAGADPGSNGLAVFARDAGTGALEFLEAERSGVDDPDDSGGAVVAMGRPSGIAESPDGAQIYVASRFGDAVQIFQRQTDPSHADHGRLNFTEALQNGLAGITGLDGAYDLAVSPDGEQLYVTAEAQNAITIFDRDPSGALSLRRTIAKDVSAGVPGLGGPQSLAVSADGLEVFVTGFADDSVTIFRRLIDEEDGLQPGDLVVRQTLFDDQGFVLEMAGPTDLALTDDNKHLYVVANEDNAILRFERISLDVLFFDGFEVF